MSTNCKGVISYIIIADIDQCLIPIDPWPYDDDDVGDSVKSIMTLFPIFFTHYFHLPKIHMHLLKEKGGAN